MKVLNSLSWILPIFNDPFPYQFSEELPKPHQPSFPEDITELHNLHYILIDFYHVNDKKKTLTCQDLHKVNAWLLILYALK